MNYSIRLTDSSVRHKMVEHYRHCSIQRLPPHHLEARERRVRHSAGNDKNQNEGMTYTNSSAGFFLIKDREHVAVSVGDSVRTASCGRSGSMLSGVTARTTSWQVPLPHYGSVLIHGDDYNAALLESATVVIINQGLFSLLQNV